MGTEPHTQASSDWKSKRAYIDDHKNQNPICWGQFFQKNNLIILSA